ncbi:MAG: alpha/beta hydrolase [Deltaproteobacteria bacterium]|nr:alpha/beta hydrolase [Deltaproteobacteria bacterium]
MSADPLSIELDLPLAHQRRRIRARRAVSTLLVDHFFFGGMARAGAMLPIAHPRLHDVRRIRNLAYGRDPAHRYDVFLPLHAPGRRPVVVYVHGGGFHAMSKDTHWLLGLIFARRGYVVFNLDYRLAPKHRFPAALEDLTSALAVIEREAAQYGGDPSQLILAGESAGANLVTSLTIATCFRREESFARVLFERGHVPRAVIPMCGILQVSNPGRLLPKLNRFYEQDLVVGCAANYLPRSGDSALADPVRMLERLEPDRPLPPFFVSAGTKDPLFEDSERLAAALTKLGVEHRARFFEGEIHAFQALVFRRAARRHWRELFSDLESFGLSARASNGRAA